MAMHFINIYDDESDAINVVDSGVVNLSDETMSIVVDLSLEIAYRKHNKLSYDSFVERLAEELAAKGII